MSEEDQQEVETPEVNQVEVEAKQFGWVPKEDFKGNETDWKDADTFMRRGREINGFLRKDLEKIQRENELHKAELREVRETMEEFRKFHNDTEARAYKRAIEDLKVAKAEAIEIGNGAKVVEIDEQIGILKEAQVKPTISAPKPKQDPELGKAFENWAKENKWFDSDSELTELAVDFGEVLKAKEPNLLGKAFLDKVTEKVKKARPDKFENEARQSSAVGSSSQSGQGVVINKKKSYNSLPPDAKAACDKFVKQKLMTQEQYIQEYQWDS